MHAHLEGGDSRRKFRIERDEWPLVLLMVVVLIDCVITVYIGEEANPIVDAFIQKYGIYSVMSAKIGLSFALASTILGAQPFWSGRDDRRYKYGTYTRLVLVAYITLYVVAWLFQGLWEAAWYLRF